MNSGEPVLSPKEVRQWRREKILKKWYVKIPIFFLDIVFLLIMVYAAWFVFGLFKPDFKNRVESTISGIIGSTEPSTLLRFEACDQVRRRLPTDLATKICGARPAGTKDQLPSDQVDFEKLGQETGYQNTELLKTMYEHGQICRGADGFPAKAGEECAYFPWTVAAAIPAGETTTTEWNDVDPREPGVWGKFLGYKDAYAQFPNDVKMAEACRQGLEAVAANPYVQAKWPGIRADQIHTSSGCSIGRGQTLAVHFRPGGLLDKLENKDVWSSYDVGAEAIYVHLTARGSGDCGNGRPWFTNQGDPNVDNAEELALCSYNPGAYGVDRYDWYWDTLHETTADLSQGYNTQAIGKLPTAFSAGTCQHDFCVMHPNGIPNPNFGFYDNYNGAFGFGDLQHSAQDFSPPDGPGIPFPVYAGCAGEVTRYELVSTNAGGVVGITCDERPDFVLEYMHLDRNTMGGFNLGSHFDPGQEVAIANGSGSASGGVHLHFVIKINGVKVDPMEYIGSTSPSSIVHATAPSEPIPPIFEGLLDQIPTQTVEDVLNIIVDMLPDGTPVITVPEGPTSAVETPTISPEMMTPVETPTPEIIIDVLGLPTDTPTPTPTGSGGAP